MLLFHPVQRPYVYIVLIDKTMSFMFSHIQIFPHVNYHFAKTDNHNFISSSDFHFLTIIFKYVKTRHLDWRCKSKKQRK